MDAAESFPACSISSTKDTHSSSRNYTMAKETTDRKNEKSPEEDRLGEAVGNGLVVITESAVEPIGLAVAMDDAGNGDCTSDEWDENVLSDTEGDHTDSSDDDDPHSQVDKLIEKGTLLYMEEENSALSSEDESDYDSESDITDVSPLVSATASPLLGLSPQLPRRIVLTSPLVLHDNRDLRLGFSEQISPYRIDPDHEKIKESCETENSTKMDLLLQAVMELESNLNSQHPSDRAKQSIHPIRDNPNHHHLRKSHLRRKNMSFSNEEVRKIDRDNKILLKKIMAAHTRTQNQAAGGHPNSTPSSTSKPTNSSINRKRSEDKIRRENLIILKKIQEARPSKDMVVDVRPPPTVAPHQLPSASSRTLRSPTGSCGASMRSMGQTHHVTLATPRKEPAL